MVKKINLLLLPFMMMLVFFQVVSAAGPSKKPLPPLQVRITSVQPGITPDQIKAGDTVELKVTAVSFMDGQELRIEVELIGGTKLVSGDKLWSGPLKKNEEKALLLTVQSPEKGRGGIRARVSIPSTDGARFSVETQYMLGFETKTKPEHERPVKKDHKGRNVIEYR